MELKCFFFLFSYFIQFTRAFTNNAVTFLKGLLNRVLQSPALVEHNYTDVWLEKRNSMKYNWHDVPCIKLSNPYCKTTIIWMSLGLKDPDSQVLMTVIKRIEIQYKECSKA